MIQRGPTESLWVLWVRNTHLPSKSGKLLATSAPYGLHKFGILVTDEVLERGRLAVLLPHEEHGNEWRHQRNARRQFQRFESDEIRHALAGCSISNLIMILATHYKFRRTDAFSRIAMTS